MYELIHAERGNIPVARACRVLGVARSGYYAWLHAKPSPRAIDDAVLAAEVKEVFDNNRGRYGAPRVRCALRRRGPRPSKKRVARMMRVLGLKAHMPRRFRRTTDSRHTKRIAPNLLERNFTAQAPNQVIAGDITYIATTDGWLYLAVLLDRSTCIRDEWWGGQRRTASTQSSLLPRCEWRRPHELWSRIGSTTPIVIAGTAAMTTSERFINSARVQA